MWRHDLVAKVEPVRKVGLVRIDEIGNLQNTLEFPNTNRSCARA